MQREVFRPLVLLCGFLLALGCAASGGKQFQAGQRAHESGELDAAVSAYQAALKAEPDNVTYKQALERVRSELASRYERDARRLEKDSDWRGASDAWAHASNAKPDDQEFKVRKELSALKAQNLGPDDWYENVRKLGTSFPGSAIIEKTLSGARTKACQHHVALGDQFLSTSEGGHAIEHYDRVKQIDASAPGVEPARYDQASALALMEQGDARLAAGDAVEAHELYQKAFEKKPLPEIKSKLSKVKAKASAVLTKLETARGLAQKGKALDALKVYESLSGAKGVPASVEIEIQKVRDDVARGETEAALAFANSGDLAKAQRSLADALRYSSIDGALSEKLKGAVQQIQDSRPGQGYRTLEGMRAEVKDSLFAAIKALAIAAAKKSCEKARALSKKNPGGALAILDDLAPFEDALPAIRELHRSLRPGPETVKAGGASDDASAASPRSGERVPVHAAGGSATPPEASKSVVEPESAGPDAQKGDARAVIRAPESAEGPTASGDKGVKGGEGPAASGDKGVKGGERPAASGDKGMKGGLVSGDDRKVAESIRALLRADPNNKEAQAAFAKLLEKARSASEKGDDKAASEALLAANIAAGAPEALTKAVSTAAAHLGERKYAESERAFLDALAISSESKLAKTGLEIARKRRLSAEKEAVAALPKPGDPLPHARVLKASLLVEPESKAVASAVALLLSRAQKSAAKAEDADAAQSLDAAALLENAGGDPPEGIRKGTSALARASFEEAEAAFSALASPKEEGSRPSKVSEIGREIARGRRIAVLRSELEAAKREGDVIRQSRAVQKILEIDHKDKSALEISKRLRSSVIESRLAAAKSQRELGKLGAAYVYLRRAVDLDAGNAKARAELQSIESLLKPGLDLVVLVDKVARAPSLSEGACKAIEAPLRESLMADGSKREDLGAYILGADWTDAVERGDKDAPRVSGTLKVTISKCQNGSGVGNLTLLWQLVVPPEGEPAAKGVIDADLPAGQIPRDEQDGEGKNAKKALAKRAAKVMFERVRDERTAIDLWLLAAAEHGMKVKDPVLVADAYARLQIKKPVSIDPVRVARVEQYLDGELK